MKIWWSYDDGNIVKKMWQKDGQMDWTIQRAAWPQLKINFKQSLRPAHILAQKESSPTSRSSSNIIIYVGFAWRYIKIWTRINQIVLQQWQITHFCNNDFIFAMLTCLFFMKPIRRQIFMRPVRRQNVVKGLVPYYICVWSVGSWNPTDLLLSNRENVC